MGRPAAETSLMRSLGMLLTGNVLAQAIPFLIAPLVARLFDAPQFALFGAVMALFNLLAVAVTGRYEMAIMIPKERTGAAHLLRGGLLVVLVMSGATFLLLFLLRDHLERWLGGEAPPWIAALIAVLTFLAGVQVIGQQWMLREGAFKRMAAVKVLQALGIAGATLLFGLLGWSSGLLMGYLAGWILFAAATWIAVRRWSPLPGSWDRATSMAALADHRAWPLHNLWPAVLNTLASGGAVLLVTMYYDDGTAGQHNFTRQYLLGPISMLTVALGQVLYQRVAARVHEGASVKMELFTVAKWLAAAALVMAVTVTFGGRWLFTFIFGVDWAGAGDMARILVWGYAAQLVASPFGVVLLGLGKVKAAMVFPVVYAILMLVPASLRWLPPDGFILVLTVVEVIAYAVYALLVAYHVSLYERRRTA